ncbi:triose-phosphate isomerase [Atopobium fossor]|uniref:triose-phosphate isomerase n=1 Tax=Atopobium fossor TaxID=39487 RepID=UPI0004124352|nr:triose-phosphate isomerase [Atopobium fossor]
MKRKDLKLPLFTVSPKTYLLGDDSISAALLTDEVAANREHSIFWTAPVPELCAVAQQLKHVIPTAQHADLVGDGKGMGLIPLESLKFAGVQAVFLNHTAHPMNVDQLSVTIDKARELEILTIVAADSVTESLAIAAMNPDVILCEPSFLVGTGQTSDDSYIEQTITAVRKVNSDIVIMEGAGIRCGDDVRRLIGKGAQGTGISSALAITHDRRALLTELFDALD